MKSILWSEADKGVTFTYGDIPADLVDKANEFREKLVEANHTRKALLGADRDL